MSLRKHVDHINPEHHVSSDIFKASAWLSVHIHFSAKRSLPIAVGVTVLCPPLNTLALGYLSIPSVKYFKASSVSSSSESTKVTHSPDSWLRPMLRASDTPPFSLWITLKRLSVLTYSSQMANEESLLPSSTIIHSQLLYDWFNTESKHLRRNLSALYTGIIILIFLHINLP